MYWKDLVIEIMFVLIIMEHESSFLHFEEILTGSLECLPSFISRNFHHQKCLFVFWGYVTSNFRVNFFKTEALFFFFYPFFPSTVISMSIFMHSLSR